MKILPFYTATAMRDDERVASNNTLLAPTWKFLPFQIQRDHVADTYIDEIKLVDCDGNETDVFSYFLSSNMLLSSWTNGPIPVNDYDTFIATGATILTAIEAGSTTWCYSNEFALATGQSVVVNYNLTISTGVLPKLMLHGASATAYSAPIEMVAGGDYIRLVATGNNSGNVRLGVVNYNGDSTSFGCTFPLVARDNLSLNEFTSYDFITYNGEPLSTTLPYGVYYLKIADGVTKWYSEWFSVQKLQPQNFEAYVSSDYDTFTTSGANITSAINLAGTAVVYWRFRNIRNGEKLIFTYDFTLNSGQAPTIRLWDAATSSTISNVHTLEHGLHQVEFTATKTVYNPTPAAVYLRIYNTAASNFSLYSASLRRKSGEYIHLEFTNTKDFNNSDKSIYYAGGFTQQAYLRSYENLPSHEIIQIGDDKNGEFILEKGVQRYMRSAVAYVSRCLYNALSLLPLHDNVKILDEVGIEHTPNAGNIDTPITWDTFDTGTMKINWTENNQIWTNSMDNIT